MANKNTKRKNADEAKKLAAKKKGNADFKQVSPKRKSGVKNFDMYKKFPGFRKEKRVA